MIYKQVQQSTYLLDYAGQRFLVDPIMGGLEKGAAKEEIKFSDLLDVDAVIATHLTKGAFDGEARRLIPRGMKSLCKMRRMRIRCRWMAFQIWRFLRKRRNFVI
mgnify:CR=1 FL=1